MKPIKVDPIKLEEILIENCAKRRWHLSNDLKADLISSMREACNQAIERCAEVQKWEYHSIGLTNSGKRVYDVILKVKEQII